MDKVGDGSEKSLDQRQDRYNEDTRVISERLRSLQVLTRYNTREQA